MSRTRRQLRQLISMLMGDLWTGTADSATNNTLTDTERSEPDDDFFNRAEISILTATAVAESRRITDFVASTDVLTVAPVWTSNPTSASAYEIHKRWTMAQYNQAIREAEEAALSAYLQDVEGTETLLVDTYEYTVPTAVEYAFELQNEIPSGSGKWYAVHKDRYFYRSGITTPKLVLRPAAWDSLTNYPNIKIRGQARATVMSTDQPASGGTCQVDELYLQYMVRAILYSMKVESSGLDVEADTRQADRYMQLAEQRKAITRQHLRPNGVKIR